MGQFAAVFVIHSANFPPVHCRCEELAGDVWLPAQQHNPRVPSTLALLCGAAVRAAGHPALRERTGRGRCGAAGGIRAHSGACECQSDHFIPILQLYCPSQPSGGQVTLTGIQRETLRVQKGTASFNLIASKNAQFDPIGPNSLSSCVSLCEQHAVTGRSIQCSSTRWQQGVNKPLSLEKRCMRHI